MPDARGRKTLDAIATIVKPDTILRWYAKLVAHNFDGSSYRRASGLPAPRHYCFLYVATKPTSDDFASSVIVI